MKKFGIFFEWLYLVLSMLALILLIVIFVLFIGVKYNFIKESPVVIAGLSAALIAFLGVVVSQVWQSSNTNKNIRSTQENTDKQIAQQQENLKQQNANLSKQLKSQQESLDKQLKAQQKNLGKQLQSASELQDKKFDGEREKYLYEYHKEAQKEVYLTLTELNSLLSSCISNAYSYAVDSFNYRYYFLTNEKEESYIKYENLSNKSYLIYEESLIELNKIRSITRFHHEINNILDKVLYENYKKHDDQISNLISKMINMTNQFDKETNYQYKIFTVSSEQIQAALEPSSTMSPKDVTNAKNFLDLYNKYEIANKESRKIAEEAGRILSEELSGDFFLALCASIKDPTPKSLPEAP